MSWTGWQRRPPAGVEAAGTGEPGNATGTEQRALIARWDLGFLESYLVDRGLVCACHASEVIAELRRFLAVVAEAGGDVAMIDPNVDRAWHAFILHTRGYSDFCRHAFGNFLHHEPAGPGRGERDSHESARRYRAAYRLVHGRPHVLTINCLVPAGGPTARADCRIGGGGQHQGDGNDNGGNGHDGR